MAEAEGKRWTQIVIMPVVVAVVGIGGTWLVTDQQHKNTVLLTQQQNRTAELARKAQIESAQETAAADRQIKVLEIFVEKIQSPEPTQREFALRILTAVDGQLAARLASAVLETETTTSVRNVATKVKSDAAAAGFSFPVVASRKTLDEALTLLPGVKETLKKNDRDYPVSVFLSDNGWYAVTLGGYLPHKEAQARASFARSAGIESEAYVRTSRTWGEDLASE